MNNTKILFVEEGPNKGSSFCFSIIYNHMNEALHHPKITQDKEKPYKLGLLKILS